MSKRAFRVFSLLATASLVASCSLMPGSNSLDNGDSKVVSFSAPDQLVAVEMSFTDRSQTRALGALGVDYFGIDRKNKRFIASMNQAQYESALKLGLKLEARKDRMLKNNFDKGYHTYDSMLAELKAVAAKYPQLCELVDVGDTWEKTQHKADRDLWAIHFKKAPGKPVVLLAGCHHARELVTPEMILGMVHLLAEGYGTDAEVTAAVDTRDIWLVPMVNPDGHVLAERGANQRKNTNNVTGGKSHIGVDLNRNYDASWGTSGDSGNPDSDVFRGSKAFSEPETQAMRDLMTRIKPVFLLTYHSFSNSVMWSWDKSDAPPPDKRLELVGTKLGKLSGYDAYQGCQMYLNSGDDVDWSFEHLGTLAYTVEVGSSGDGFDPPFSKVAQFWKENRPMMQYVLKVADNPSAAAGPELAAATSNGAQLGAQAVTAAVGAEYFLGTPGAAGSGHPMSVSGQRVVAALNASSAARQLVYMHARGADGTWGPWTVSWSK